MIGDGSPENYYKNSKEDKGGSGAPVTIEALEEDFYSFPGKKLKPINLDEVYKTIKELFKDLGYI